MYFELTLLGGFYIVSLGCTFALLFAGIFTNHPFPYVRPAMEKLDASLFAGIQKAHDLDIHEGHALEVQRDGRLFAIDLHL